MNYEYADITVDISAILHDRNYLGNNGCKPISNFQFSTFNFSKYSLIQSAINIGRFKRLPSFFMLFIESLILNEGLYFLSYSAKLFPLIRLSDLTSIGITVNLLAIKKSTSALLPLLLQILFVQKYKYLTTNHTLSHKNVIFITLYGYRTRFF